MERLLREEQELTFKPVINAVPGVSASLQIFNPELPSAGFKKGLTQQRDIILRQRAAAEVS